MRLSSVFEPAGGALAVRFDPVGGMQTHTGELTRALDARGVRQVVLTTGAPQSRRVGRVGRRAVVARLGGPVAMCRQFYSIPAARLVWRMADTVDLVHVHLGEDLAIVPLGLAAARRGNLPLVLTVHSSLRRTVQINGPRSAALKVLGSLCERVGEHRADRVLVLTPRMRDELTADGVAPERITVVPSGVNPELFDPSRPKPTRAGRCVLFVGRLHPQKGVDQLVRALPRLADALLVLAGDGPERGALQRLAVRLGLADRVRFLGFVDHDAIPDLLRSADVFVMPSRYEELGTAVVEAMASGVPVVAARVGGLPELVRHGHTGLLVEPGDPRALAGAIDAVLTDPGLARRLAEGARERSFGYQWPTLADQVLRTYRELVS